MIGLTYLVQGLAFVLGVACVAMVPLWAQRGRYVMVVLVIVLACINGGTFVWQMHIRDSMQINRSSR